LLFLSVDIEHGFSLLLLLNQIITSILSKQLHLLLLQHHPLNLLLIRQRNMNHKLPLLLLLFLPLPPLFLHHTLLLLKQHLLHSSNAHNLRSPLPRLLPLLIQPPPLLHFPPPHLHLRTPLQTLQDPILLISIPIIASVYP